MVSEQWDSGVGEEVVEVDRGVGGKDVGALERAGGQDGISGSGGGGTRQQGVGSGGVGWRDAVDGYGAGGQVEEVNSGNGDLLRAHSGGSADPTNAGGRKE